MMTTRLLMGMPITVQIADTTARVGMIDAVFDYFRKIDQQFSAYKKTSEISQINAGEVSQTGASPLMRTILALSEETKQLTEGYFDIARNGRLDPSGLVKGYAILQAAELLDKFSIKNYFVDAGGDIQVRGENKQRMPWKVGIRNPFNRDEVVKVITLKNQGIATSGTAIRGQHIYNPHDTKQEAITDIVSITVIGPNVYEADRFATAAFAMGEKGIRFLEQYPGLEGYMINTNGIAT